MATFQLQAQPSASCSNWAISWRLAPAGATGFDSILIFPYAAMRPAARVTRPGITS